MSYPIAATRLATGSQVGLLGGFSYYTGKPAANNGATYSTGGTVFKTNGTDLGIFYFVGSCEWAFNVGLFGPVWSHSTVVSGTCYPKSEGGRVDLVCDRSRTITTAGMQFGCDLILNFQCQVEYLAGYEWVGGWDGYPARVWRTAFSIPLQSIKIDLFKVLETLIRFILAKSGKASPTQLKNTTANGGLFGNFMLEESRTNGLPCAYNGILQMLPALALRIDLVQYVPPLAAIQKSLRAALGNLAAGPTFGIQFPLQISICLITASGVGGMPAPAANVDYRVPYFSNAKPTNIKGVWNWFYGIDLSVGVFFSISAAQIFSYDTEVHFGLLQAIGVTPTGFSALVTGCGPASNVGQATAQADWPGMEVPEIVFA